MDHSQVAVKLSSVSRDSVKRYQNTILGTSGCQSNMPMAKYDFLSLFCSDFRSK